MACRSSVVPMSTSEMEQCEGECRCTIDSSFMMLMHGYDDSRCPTVVLSKTFRILCMRGVGEKHCSWTDLDDP